MEHKVKCHPEHFVPMIVGLKTHDTRLNDRNYNVGDTILQEEYDPKLKTYTGRNAQVMITYIYRDKGDLNFRLPEGVVIMSTKLLSVHNEVG